LNSSCLSLFCLAGTSYNQNQNNNHINPIAPVMIKAQRQPYCMAINGTVSGAMIAPMFVPELKIPVANALSRLGNHSAIALIADGKFPDSVKPKKPLATKNPVVLFTSACPIAATLQRNNDNA